MLVLLNEEVPRDYICWGFVCILTKHIQLKQVTKTQRCITKTWNKNQLHSSVWTKIHCCVQLCHSAAVLVVNNGSALGTTMGYCVKKRFGMWVIHGVNRRVNSNFRVN